MRRLHVLAFAVACSFGAMESAGAQRAARGPDDVVRAVLRADSLGEWRSILALAHPDAITEFRESQVRALDFGGNEFFMRDLSQCMKDQIERSRRMRLDSIYRVSSVDALAKLPADTVFARHHRWIADFSRTASEDTVMPRGRLSYLGHLMADDSTAYGIILETWNRRPIPDWPTRRPQIITVRRLGSEWRTMLDIDGLRSDGQVFMSTGCS